MSSGNLIFVKHKQANSALYGNIVVLNIWTCCVYECILFSHILSVRLFYYLIEFVLLAELYTLSPAVVAFVQIRGDTSELYQIMFL